MQLYFVNHLTFDAYLCVRVLGSTYQPVVTCWLSGILYYWREKIIDLTIGGDRRRLPFTRVRNNVVPNNYSDNNLHTAKHYKHGISVTKELYKELYKYPAAMADREKK